MWSKSGGGGVLMRYVEHSLPMIMGANERAKKGPMAMMTMVPMMLMKDTHLPTYLQDERTWALQGRCQWKNSLNRVIVRDLPFLSSGAFAFAEACRLRWIDERLECARRRQQPAV